MRNSFAEAVWHQIADLKLEICVKDLEGKWGLKGASARARETKENTYVSPARARNKHIPVHITY